MTGPDWLHCCFCALHAHSLLHLGAGLHVRMHMSTRQVTLGSRRKPAVHQAANRDCCGHPCHACRCSAATGSSGNMRVHQQCFYSKGGLPAHSGRRSSKFNSCKVYGACCPVLCGIEHLFFCRHQQSLIAGCRQLSSSNLGIVHVQPWQHASALSCQVLPCCEFHRSVAVRMACISARSGMRL